MPDESFDAIRTRVLTDNTAQGVLNHLNALESNRAHVLTRWVWELLQNARDASIGSDTELVASVEQNEGELIFRHNGADFKIDEIAHLIYHGSTKVEQTTTIGQYGSGFLATHLLSSEIDVSGLIEDGRCFEFPLKREIGSVSELSQSMEQAWKDFENSLRNALPADCLNTQFRYPLNSDAVDAVEKGIATLKQCAPFVVVFNQEFSSIDIKSSDGTMRFTVTDRFSLEQGKLYQVTVEVSENGVLTELKYLLALGEKVSVAIPLESGDNTKCLPVGEIPKLFLGFPLVGTDNFSFPAVINSLNFTPTENRDGVYLAQGENEANKVNQEAIKEACGLLVGLLQFAASSGWHNAHLLADIPIIPNTNWLNRKWMRDRLNKLLIEEIRKAPVAINEAGEAISPDALEIPLADTDDGVVALWDLLDGWQGYRERLPRRDEAAGWCAAAKGWAIISGDDFSSFSEVTDGRKLAERVQKISHDPSAANLTTHRMSRLNLKEGVVAINWLDQLISFFNSNRLSDVVRKYRIIPSQGGFLRTLSGLYRDCGIHEELKNIADLLEWRIRPELRDVRVTSLADDPGAGNWDNAHVVGELIKRLQKRAENNRDDNFGKASVRLFTWIVSQENWELLRGFPAFSDRGESDNWSIIWLERVEGDEERPLSPVKSWPQSLQSFSDIFPLQHILSDAFFESMPDHDVWQILEAKDFIRTSVIIRNKVNLSDFLPDEPLPDQVAHRTKTPVVVTDLTFISKDRIGVMERVRNSQSRARLFWSFLTEWLVKEDVRGLEKEKETCECGDDHQYFKAAWLVPLMKNKWVPLRGDRHEQLTAQSLANLLRGSGWEPGSMNENSAAIKFLEAINVTGLDLVREFGSETEEQRKVQDAALAEILVAAAGDTGRLSFAYQYIEDLKDDEALPDILDKRRESRRIVHENQRLGSQVEELVRQSLETEGFDVHRTGVGSDFEISYNSTETDDVARLVLSRAGRSWLIEVKATRDLDVRMTTTQAKTAVEQGSRFLLCVVPVALGATEIALEDVRANMRFVENIGPRVEKLCADLDDLEGLRNSITAGGNFDVQLEVMSGTARVRVNSPVWQNDGFLLENLLNRLLK